MKRALAMALAIAQIPTNLLFYGPPTMVDPIMAGHMGDLILGLGCVSRTSIV